MSTSSFAPIEIKVKDLWIVKGGGVFSGSKSILQSANLDVKSGQFVAVIGPNGAGKTTFFRSLIGDKPYRGRIMLYREDGSQDDFEDFYDNPEYWMELIGYIPVDNVLHEELTVRQALMHIGRLRLPHADDQEILQKINSTITKLGFRENDYRLDQFVGTLSSGERKKMNIASELLTDPPLLLLDEPTSNLDPNAERDLMNSLKKLAGSSNNGQGPTILLITHTLETLDRCDQVAFIENSKLVADGNIDEVFDQMKANALNDAKEISDVSIPNSIDTNKFEDWAFIFDVYKTDENRAKRLTTSPPQRENHSKAVRRETKSDSFWRQFKILLHRYYSLRFNDLNGIFTLLASGFVAGFLLLIAPSDIFLRAEDATPARQTFVLLAILIVIMGAFNSHREISKEFRIYIHERTKGLKPLAYLVSKLVWLSVVVALFATTMIMALIGTPIARWFSLGFGALLFIAGFLYNFFSTATRSQSTRDKLIRTLRLLVIAVPFFLAFLVQMQDKTLPETPISPITVEIVMYFTLVLAGIAASASGILLSSVVGSNNDRATQLVIAFILFNVILAFSVLVVAAPEFRPLFDTLEPLSASYWGYSGVSAGMGIYCWAGRPVIENFNSIGYTITTWLYLIVHIIVTLGLSVMALRFQETWTSRQRTLTRMLSPAREGINYVVVTAVAALLIWGGFLTNMSQEYFDLTYFDRLFSSNRYADIDNIEDTSQLEQIIGLVSQSACEIPVNEDATPDA